MIKFYGVIFFFVSIIFASCQPESASKTSSVSAAFVRVSSAHGYPDLFVDAGVSRETVSDALTAVWNAYFGNPGKTPDTTETSSNPGAYPGDATELYFNAPDGNAFIFSQDAAYSVWSNSTTSTTHYGDVRTEGMSYGMMISVQTNHQAQFDKLWKWAKAHMQKSDGLFYWHCTTSGVPIDDSGYNTKCGSAPDGEQYFAMALFFASHRWGDNSTGIDYSGDANALLKAMITQSAGDTKTSTTFNEFNTALKQPVFVPNNSIESTFTDPSYHLPAFYTLWSKWATYDPSFWAGAATAARNYFHSAINPKTGLSPDYSTFDGTPYSYTYNTKSKYYAADAWRTIMNTSLDWSWFNGDGSEPAYADHLQSFFLSQAQSGMPSSESGWTVDGADGENGYGYQVGQLAINAVGGLAATNKDNAKTFLVTLAQQTPPSGWYRYYNGLLYYLGLLVCSGNYQIY